MQSYDRFLKPEIPVAPKSVEVNWPPTILEAAIRLVKTDSFHFSPKENLTIRPTGLPYVFELRQIMYDYIVNPEASALDHMLIGHVLKGGLLKAMQTACDRPDAKLKLLQANRMLPGDELGAHIHLNGEFEFFGSVEIITAPHESGILYTTPFLGSRDRTLLPGGAHILNICHAHQPHGVTKILGEPEKDLRLSILLGI
jgi:hypothetical protein